MTAPYLEIVGNVLLFALVFGMSATVDIKCMEHQVRNKKAILLGILCQFILLPFIGYCTVDLLNLDAPLGITLLVVTSSPGGSYSNWWCSLFNADLALSVTMTAISTLFSVLSLPGNLFFYANIAYEKDVTTDLDWKSVFIALAVVISGVALGLYSSYRKHSYKFNILANRLGNMAGFLLITFSATMTNMGGEADSKIWSREPTFYLSCLIPCIIALFVASFLASLLNLEKPERMTVAIECCYQNVGIGTSLAMTMFQGNDLNRAMGIPFFYGICEAVLVGVYCVGCWKAGWSKAPINEPLWKILFTSYEVLEAEKMEAREIEVSVSSSDLEKEDDHQDGPILFTYFQLDSALASQPKSPSGRLPTTENANQTSVI